jgi:hypothetical protein
MSSHNYLLTGATEKIFIQLFKTSLVPACPGQIKL